MTAKNRVSESSSGNNSSASVQPGDNGSSAQPGNNGSAPPKATATDWFADLNAIRLSQDFGTTLGVKKALLTVPIRKPAKEWFVRTHPNLRVQTNVIELKEDREIYLVAPPLWAELKGESTFGPRALYGAMNRQGVLFVWSIRLPDEDERIDEWNRSALEAAGMAEAQWVRVASNMELGAYDVFHSSADWPEPAWPDLPFNEILRVAFKGGRIIETLEHPALKRLRGEA
jgi:hypothetical protein